jgi:hypothetical protein
MSAAKTVTATFTQQYDLTVARTGSGSGSLALSSGQTCSTASCSYPFNSGTSVTVTANPASGSVFTSWTGCDSVTGNVCTVAMTAAKTVTATFIQQYNLTVARTGTGSGTLVLSTGQSCTGVSCGYLFTSGTIVTVTANAASGSNFTGWVGCDSVNGKVCTVTMASAMTVTATFTANPSCSVKHGSACYATLGDAYAAIPAGTSTVLLAQGVTFPESLVVNRDVTVTIQGGYDVDFVSRNGTSTLQGNVTINGTGTLIMESIAIQ